ncbi:glycosyltransferase family 2 protein [Jeongeupia naejangsanensis]|uniref:Glycosyltransferase family 2 protein n=1 Tax=Jeongeupia naejangsanensis TaxID=613195 RepID=A0ABS2BNK0_9NEIS|nr:glycosyltransferase family 2 protein [Jeongeupia naejangsanensis]MBM3117133.1 glycosyltransferase family 2 protein [Jeongeupia naejangsanensis]
MSCIAVIPVYNHGHAIGAVVDALRGHDLPVLLVDDGSEPHCAAVLDRLATLDGVTLLRHTHNQGKGAACVSGFREAAALGYSHALQIDADGQHDTADVPRFLAEMAAHPDAVIAGCPVYDDSVPKGRLYGRYATHVWVWINTLSLRITDSMCGYRIYPLAPTLPVLGAMPQARRMDFDPEVLVRLDWAGVPVVNLPTRVRYPADGVSHFDYWRDNVRISRMHTRLFFGMLRRSPRLLARHLGAQR